MRKNCAIWLLLACTCLLSHPSNAQTSPPPVVRLVPGMVVRRPLVGLDTAYYRAVRVEQHYHVRLIGKLDTIITAQHRLHLLDSAKAAEALREMKAGRLDLSTCDAALTESGERNRKLLALPLRPPLWADHRVYVSAGVGVVLGLLLSRY